LRLTEIRRLYKIFKTAATYTFARFLLVTLIVVTGFSISTTVYAAPVSNGLPMISDFRVSPSIIDAGSSATLLWDVDNVLSVTVDHGIGKVSSKGEARVSPPYTTTYRITTSNEAGIRERYITLSVNPAMVETGDIIGVDPVTGRNAEIDLTWEQLCLATGYEIQIAKDRNFTQRVNPAVNNSGAIAAVIGSIPMNMDAFNMNSPAAWIAPGVLEAGHTYYWRARTARSATGQYAISPWSDAKPFTVQPGFPVRTDYYGIQAFNPANGCLGCPTKPVSFSWSGYPATTKYRFILARDSQLQNIIVEAFTTTTSYALNEALEYDTSYFWQVMAVEPIPSDPSSLFTFHTESAPKQLTQQVPVASTGETPAWAWVVIIASGILLVVVVFLVARAGGKKY